MQTFVCENLFEKTVDKPLFEWYSLFRTVVHELMFGVIIMKYTERTDSRSRRRRQVAFYKGIILCTAVFVCIILSIIVSNTWKVDASGEIQRHKEYIIVEVKSGDTLWSIAESYKTDDYNSIRQLIEEIEEVNGLTDDTLLKPGNRIMVPAFIEEMD